MPGSTEERGDRGRIRRQAAEEGRGGPPSGGDRRRRGADDASQASKAQAAAGEGSSAAAWPTGNSAVGLTEQRLVLFNYTAMGKPKDLVAEFPLDQLQAVELEKKKVTANALTFRFVDGSAVQVECAKLEKTADFVEAFQRARSGA
jgi:hypothetical protein